MIVCKFGGTSVADRAAQARLVEIVRGRLASSPLVVVSALAGVSDALIAILEAAVAGEDERSAATLEALAARHRVLLEATPAPPEAAAACRAALAEALASLESVRRGAVLLADTSAWVRARFLAGGELLASRLVALAFAAAGIDVSWVDARTVVRTQGTDAERDVPAPAEIARFAAEALAPRLGPGRVVVTQGFVGADGSGRTTLLGRGGSDYTASLLGAALGAERIEIWTDVDGVLTANPRIVPEARRLRRLSFAEASELAYFGARVLHPSTILPAVEAGVPVWVGNARRPDGDGTTILDQPPAADERWVVKAIADKRGITVVEVASTRMLMAHGFLARIFEVFDAHLTAVDLVSTSEVSVSLTVDDDRRLPEIVAALSRFARVNVQPDMAVVCLVGEGMRGRTGIAADVFRAIRFARVRMITQGASAINLSLVVPADETDAVVSALHEVFFGGSLPAEIFGESHRDLETMDRGRAAARRGVGAGGPVPLSPSLAELARRFGTPLYVYDLDAIAARARHVLERLGGAGRRLFYACKANAHPAVVRTIAAAGFGVEAASPGEAERALACGLPPDRVLLSATNARPPDLAAALERGMSVTLGAPSEIPRVGALVPGREVLLRVNPGVGDGHHARVVTGGAHSKFGIRIEELDEAMEAAARSKLVVRGLHAHIGSGIADHASLLASARRLLEAASRHATVRVLDLGGGFGIPYREGDREFDLAAYGSGVSALLAEFDGRFPARPELWFEPGRFVVAPAGFLVAEVTCRKESAGLTFVGLDTGMNHLLRPALYGAYHRIVNLSSPDAPPEWVEVVGNICETTDVLAWNRPVPRPEEGHLLAFLDVGAYGYSMASRYNLWPLPREVTVSEGRAEE